MTVSSSCPVLRASTPGELVRLLPHFFGFPPKESVILLTVTGKRVEAAGRLDASAVLDSDPDLLRARLSMFESPSFVIGWMDDERSAQRAVDIVSGVLGGADQRIVVSGGRYRCDDGQWVDLPPELASDDWVASRAALVAEVAGPGAGASTARWWAACRRIARLRLEQRCARAATLLATGIDSEVSEGDKLELAALVSQGAVRDRLWRTLTRRNADEHVRFWKQVVQVVPDVGAPAVLGMLGMAAWVSGRGALQACCVERGLALEPEHSLLLLVEAINLMGVHPRAWTDMQASLQGDVKLPPNSCAAAPSWVRRSVSKEYSAR